MRDWFAAYRKRSAASKSGVSGVSGVSDAENPQKTSVFWTHLAETPDTPQSARCVQVTDDTPSVDPEASDWRDLYAERAAIREYDGGLDRAIAEQRAFDDVLQEWGQQHPQKEELHLCIGCGEPLGKVTIALPNGARAHYEPGRICLEAGVAVFQRGAIAALASFGIVPPPGW